MIGIAAGNSAGTVIGRAIWVMLGGWVIGIVIGSVAQRAVETEIRRHKERNPIPTDDEDEGADAEAPQDTQTQTQPSATP